MIWVERITFSIAIYIGVVALILFWLNWIFGIKITEINVWLVAIGAPLLVVLVIALRDPNFRDRLKNRLPGS